MPDAPSESTTLVLCEGKEDKAFLEWVAESAGLGRLVIREVGGKDASAAKFQAFVQDPTLGAEPSAVVVVFDADDRPADRRKSIQGRLKKAAPNARREIYLLPDNEGPGDLEDLCLAACTDVARLACADALVTCLESNGYDDFKRSKLKLLAYIAATQLERRSIEYAAKGGQFDLSHELIQRLAAFLNDCMVNT